MLKNILQIMDVLINGLPGQIPVNSPAFPEVVTQVAVDAPQLIGKSILGEFPETRGFFQKIQFVFIQADTSFLKFFKKCR